MILRNPIDIHTHTPSLSLSLPHSLALACSFLYSYLPCLHTSLVYVSTLCSWVLQCHPFFLPSSCYLPYYSLYRVIHPSTNYFLLLFLILFIHMHILSYIHSIPPTSPTWRDQGGSTVYNKNIPLKSTCYNQEMTYIYYWLRKNNSDHSPTCMHILPFPNTNILTITPSHDKIKHYTRYERYNVCY